MGFRFSNRSLLVIALIGAATVVGSAPASAGVFTQAAEEGDSALLERLVPALTVREALVLMEEGILTSSEYVEILIDRIQEHPEINAFILLDEAGALAAAAEADTLRAAGETLGPLHGLPIVLKDSVNTAELPTTAGTPALAGFQPQENAPVARTLIDAGAIVLGKTNLHELSAGTTTNNAFTGPTLNPYDFDRIPGGSSGGNSAALAARFVPVALGEDTAGSVRIPAALTGTTGFRPTTGRYPQEGIAPLASSLDTAGPMARDVLDLALLDAVLAGEPPGLATISLEEIRLGVPDAFFQDQLDPAVERSFRDALGRLERAGVTLVPADVPEVGELTVFQTFGPIFFFEAKRDLTEYLEEHDTGVTFEEVVAMIASPDVAELFQIIASEPVPEGLYQLVVDEVLPVVRGIYQAYLDAHDLDGVIYPTTLVPAVRIGQDIPQVDGVGAYLHNAHYTPVVGAPTLTLPMGQTEENLPAGGIDLAGSPGDDRRILAIGHAIFEVLPRIRPPVEIEPIPLPF